MSGPIILCADDFALTSGVSRAICDLAERGRISAASVLITQPAVGRDAAALGGLSGRLAMGLHLNLTLDRPLSAMPVLAPGGTFPTAARLIAASLRGRLPLAELSGEIARQLRQFEDVFGMGPDFVDGHQHVHALPGVRSALFAALRQRTASRAILLRDPADTAWRIAQRGLAVGKALAISGLARGFGREARAQGFLTNDSFSGVTTFSASAQAVRDDFRKAQRRPGCRHIIMCHPGFADADLAAMDCVTRRREIEYQVVLRDDVFAQGVWRPVRSADGHIVWRGQGGHRS